MSPLSTRHRFRDPRSTKYDFLVSVLVRCPGCAKAAHVVTAPAPAPAGRQDRGLFAPRRLVCRSCGTSKQWSGRGVSLHRDPHKPAADPYFDIPLWLQTETRHGWVWAYNLEHLDLIRRFVQASLREGIPWHDHGRKMTVVARLPAWMQHAKNRDEVLRAIDRIHASLVHA
ncbi:hypothetical protein KBY91_26180 [Streptomyces sp. RK23]|uniref:hypothetical protein n=1 Tax=unclassified Streptomyces TaxID=2593676 RepID=UPI001370F554|nr:MULTISPECIES: hypothetical protein [unclassified Streptomyces]MBQ0966962.1 hypothetical protein [Streptomyces sp. RK74B]MBQ1006892.1 hypothetical protein [Streptomyces sp. RK23]MZG14671.1 hypothetical protein [Streptomyces sp. SID5914]